MSTPIKLNQKKHAVIISAIIIENVSAIHPIEIVLSITKILVMIPKKLFTLPITSLGMFSIIIVRLIIRAEILLIPMIKYNSIAINKLVKTGKNMLHNPASK